MQELIAIQKRALNGMEFNSVDAREIHKFLEVKSRFNDWFKNRSFGFRPDVDFLIVTKKIVTEPDDVYVSLDMAKHLGMIERNDKGIEIRNYFIEAEKQSRQPIALTTADQIQLLAKGHGEIEQRLDKIENNSRITVNQEFDLTQAKNEIVYRYAGDDKKAATAFHRKVWSLFKKRFRLASYKQLPNGQFNDGLVFLRGLTLADLV